MWQWQNQSDYFLLGPVRSSSAWQEPCQGLVRHGMLFGQRSGSSSHYFHNTQEYFQFNNLTSDIRITWSHLILISELRLLNWKCLPIYLTWLGKLVARGKGPRKTVYTENSKDQTFEKSILRLWNAALLSSALQALLSLAFALSSAFPAVYRWCGTMIMSMALMARLPGFGPWLYLLFAAWSWVVKSFLCASFLHLWNGLLWRLNEIT